MLSASSVDILATTRIIRFSNVMRGVAGDSEWRRKLGVHLHQKR